MLTVMVASAYHSTWISSLGCVNSMASLYSSTSISAVQDGIQEYNDVLHATELPLPLSGIRRHWL